MEKYKIQKDVIPIYTNKFHKQIPARNTLITFQFYINKVCRQNLFSFFVVFRNSKFKLLKIYI